MRDHKLPYPSKHFWVLKTFERKHLAKVKKLWVQEPFIIECFQNILCIPFCLGMLEGEGLISIIKIGV